MLAIYNVIERGRQTSFALRKAVGNDAPRLLTKAAGLLSGNGGSFTEALAEVRNESSGLEHDAEGARPLERLFPDEADALNGDFGMGGGAVQRVTIDLDTGRMRVEHDLTLCGRAVESQTLEIAPQIIEALKQAREAPAIRLKDLVLLGLPPANVYLVHKQNDVGTIPASGLRDLTGRGRTEFADLLSAKVDAIRPGAYGVELVMTGILPERLVEFDRAQAAMLRAGPYLEMFCPGGWSQEPIYLEEAVQAVRDYLCFERDTTQIWPWSLSADEMLSDENRLREIGAALHYDLEDGYDTEEIYQALTDAFGVNPALEQDQGQTMAP